MIDKAEIKLSQNRKFIIQAKNNSKSNMYIQQVLLNGKLYPKTYIDHSTILKGGTLEFVMGAAPNKKWGVESFSFPSSVND
jgi:putative alpha-1,2-mannosidase